MQKINSLIENEIVSVIIDGSVIRGDFIEDSSEIDITITTFHQNVDLQVKKHIEEIIKNIYRSYLYKFWTSCIWKK